VGVFFAGVALGDRAKMGSIPARDANRGTLAARDSFLHDELRIRQIAASWRKDNPPGLPAMTRRTAHCGLAKAINFCAKPDQRSFTAMNSFTSLSGGITSSLSSLSPGERTVSTRKPFRGELCRQAGHFKFDGIVSLGCQSTALGQCCTKSQDCQDQELRTSHSLVNNGIGKQ